MDPDLPLIEALQAGDESALNELIDRHREPLVRFVFRYLRDETSARDVVQETFVRVFFKAEKFEPRSLVKTWIYAIAVNLCRDQGRRLSRRGWEISLNVPRGEEHNPLELVDPSDGPDLQAGHNETFAVLRQAIDQLPHKLKAALVLFSLEGHSQKEVAEMLRTTPKTVELRVAHAKEKLRKLLPRDFSALPPFES